MFVLHLWLAALSTLQHVQVITISSLFKYSQKSIGSNYSWSISCFDSEFKVKFVAKPGGIESIGDITLSETLQFCPPCWCIKAIHGGHIDSSLNRRQAYKTQSFSKVQYRQVVCFPASKTHKHFISPGSNWYFCETLWRQCKPRIAFPVSRWLGSNWLSSVAGEYRGTRFELAIAHL